MAGVLPTRLSDAAMKCLVVTAHPISDNLGHALAHTVISTLSSHDHDYVVEDLLQSNVGLDGPDTLPQSPLDLDAGPVTAGVPTTTAPTAPASGESRLTSGLRFSGMREFDFPSTSTASTESRPHAISDALPGTLPDSLTSTLDEVLRGHPPATGTRDDGGRVAASHPRADHERSPRSAPPSFPQEFVDTLANPLPEPALDEVAALAREQPLRPLGDDPVANADALVLVFPAHGTHLPRALDEWIETVWTPARHGLNAQGDARNRVRLRRVLVIATISTPRVIDRHFLRQPIKRRLRAALPDACVPGCKFSILSIYAPDRLSSVGLRNASARIQSSIARWH